MIFRFGEFELNVARYELARQGRHVAAEPRVLEVLAYLVTHRDRVVPKDELLTEVWEEDHVSESALTRAIKQARQLLEDPSWIKAVYGRGYAFQGDVTAIRDEDLKTPSSGAPPMDEAPPIQHVRLGWPVPTALAVAALGLALIALLRGPTVPDGIVRPPDQVRSIAVLPLIDLTGNPEEEYFALGLTESLITRLTRLGALRVISRTSVMRYQDTQTSRREIARELDVEAILEGSVLRAGDRVRVTAELIRVETGEHLWSGEYEREMGDILRLQAEIARVVAAAVELRLTAREESLIADTADIDSEAYRAYLRGRFHWNRRTTADLEKSLGLFRQAIELDPGYAAAHSGLADAYILLSAYYGMPPEEALPLARQAAARALAIDPMLAEAYASLGAVHWTLDWDFAAAGDAYRRAIEFGPGYATAHQWYAELLSVIGQHDEAVAAGRRAWHLDPLSPIVNAALGQRLNAAGRWNEALEQFADTLALEPRFAWIHREMAYAHTNAGRIDLALAERQREMTIREIDEAWLAELQPVVDRSDLPGFWRWELRRLERKAVDGYVPALLFAEAREGIGDREQALEDLAQALLERGDYILILSTSPELAALVRDSRACPSLTKAGLAHLCEPPVPQ